MRKRAFEFGVKIYYRRSPGLQFLPPQDFIVFARGNLQPRVATARKLYRLYG